MTLRYRVLPHQRRKQLRELLTAKQGLRIMEAHDGLSGLIATTAEVADAQGNPQTFDGLWISSLTDSASKGHPDTEVIDTSSRLQTIQEILQVTDKPIIVDGDTGGEATQFEYFVSKLENMGVSAVVIEDKTYPKRNSLVAGVVQNLEDPHKFATKINRAKAVCLSDDFMIFARIESFIAGRDLNDALRRADIYLDSQADGLLIHSSAKNADQVYAFMDAYQELCAKKGVYKPVICVPTTYNQYTDNTFFEKGFSIVIYANHLIRAAHLAMRKACESILTHQRSYELNDEIAPVKAIMEKVGFLDVKAKDDQYREIKTPVVMLASGQPSGFADTDDRDKPVSEISIAGKSLGQWQVSTLQNIGLNDITLLSGYGHDQLNIDGVKVIRNERHAETNFLHSLMLAQDKLSNGFVMLFGDIFFDQTIIEKYLLPIDSDILLLVDDSVNLRTRKIIKPSTDLVILQQSNDLTSRKPNVVTEHIADIGSDIPLENATHEFIGMAKFSKNGARLFCDAYAAMKDKDVDFFDVLKALIAKDVAVDALDVNRGWSEVHNMTDVAAIEKILNRSKQKSNVTKKLAALV